MTTVGKGVQRDLLDYMLTRYACYLIAENVDPRKEQIAFAQSYFAIQTRKMELIEERISYIERTEARGRLRVSEKRLSQNIYERGVDDAGFGRIRSKGDKALFGGRSTKEMKDLLGVKENRPLADFLPTLTIAAKNLATEMTNYNVEEKDLQGESVITVEHDMHIVEKSEFPVYERCHEAIISETDWQLAQEKLNRGMEVMAIREIHIMMIQKTISLSNAVLML